MLSVDICFFQFAQEYLIGSLFGVETWQLFNVDGCVGDWISAIFNLFSKRLSPDALKSIQSAISVI